MPDPSSKASPAASSAASPETRAAAALDHARGALLEARGALLDALRTERGRRRGALNLRLHEVERMLAPDTGHASQAGQDRAVDRLLGGLRGGVFADIGGYDGLTGSNTLFFEARRGWTGILVEPVLANLEAARLVRRCPCLGLAVAAAEGEAEFLEVASGFRQMSGLLDSYDPGLLAQVRADPRHDEVVRRVPTRPLAAILEEAGLGVPDFVSLDIEGGEPAALAAFPFDRFPVRVWAIENNTAAPDVGRIMRAAGYGLAEFCGQDEIWLRQG